MESLFFDLEGSPVRVYCGGKKTSGTYIVGSRSLLVELSGPRGDEGFGVGTYSKNFISKGSGEAKLAAFHRTLDIPSNFFLSFAGRCALLDCCSMLYVKRCNTSQLHSFFYQRKECQNNRVQRSRR
jgi:hypothetical protein